MAKARLLTVDYQKDGFFRDDEVTFIIEYEEKRWYWFGKTKLRSKAINVPRTKSKFWLKAIQEKVGVWKNL
jgi:hypothetical protein